MSKASRKWKEHKKKVVNEMIAFGCSPEKNDCSLKDYRRNVKNYKRRLRIGKKYRQIFKSICNNGYKYSHGELR